MAEDRRSKRATLRRRRWLRWAVMAALVLVLVTGLGVAAAAFWVLTILPGSLPSVSQLERFDASEGTKVYDDNDELITEFHVERRIFVPLAQIPKALREAIIATEDARFYSHYGVDPMGIARAVYQNFRRGRIVEGGSTITQQLAKVLFLTPDKSLERKLKEAVLALELERRYSKDRIIEMYLNQIYFGHGAFGVEAAARTFFGKSVTDLSLPESTLLAGLPKAPVHLLAVRAPGGREAAARHRARAHGGRRLAGHAAGQEGGRQLARPHPARAPPHHRPALPRVRPAAARGPVRRRPRLQGRHAGLHHPVAADAGQGRAVAARGPQGARVTPASPRSRTRPVRAPRAPGGRAAHHRSRRPATSRRWWGATTSSRASSTVRCRRAVSPDRPSSPSSTWPRSSPARPPRAWWTTRPSSSRPAATASRGSPRTTTASSAGPSPTSRRWRSRSTWPRSRSSRRTASAAPWTSPGASASRAPWGRTSRSRWGRPI